MAKTDANVETREKEYPDLSGLFVAKEAARRERAKASPSEKFQMVAKLHEINKVFKTAKIIKRMKIKG